MAIKSFTTLSPGMFDTGKPLNIFLSGKAGAYPSDQPETVSILSSYPYPSISGLAVIVLTAFTFCKICNFLQKKFYYFSLHQNS